MFYEYKNIESGIGYEVGKEIIKKYIDIERCSF